jgi:putative NADH-flavin reductase
MKIAILGSTGFVGKVLLEKALEKGYQVKTLVRNPEKLSMYKKRVEFIQGDVFQTDKLEETVRGTEVVFSTVPPEGKTKEPEKYAKVMEDMVAVLERNAIKRLIHIGGAAHDGGVNENWTLGRWFLRLFLNLVWKTGLVAKQLEWEVLKKSYIDWTLVRPPRITKGEPTGNLLADEKNLARIQVNVEDLANFMLEQMTSETWIKKAPLVASVK